MRIRARWEILECDGEGDAPNTAYPRSGNMRPRMKSASSRIQCSYVSAFRIRQTRPASAGIRMGSGSSPCCARVKRNTRRASIFAGKLLRAREATAGCSSDSRPRSTRPSDASTTFPDCLRHAGRQSRLSADESRTHAQPGARQGVAVCRLAGSVRQAGGARRPRKAVTGPRAAHRGGQHSRRRPPSAKRRAAEANKLECRGRDQRANPKGAHVPPVLAARMPGRAGVLGAWRRRLRSAGRSLAPTGPRRPRGGSGMLEADIFCARPRVGRAPDSAPRPPCWPRRGAHQGCHDHFSRC
jgi:hypothetical protein